MANIKKTFIYSFFIAILLYSCASEPEKEHIQNKQEASKKTIAHNTSSSKSKSFSEDFIIHKPADYNASQLYPVCFIFDSHARANIPLKKYKQIADQFSVVLVASTYSQNGIQLKLIEDHFSQVYSLVKKDIHIDDNNVFTLGFSGGGRVAYHLANKFNYINGAISCGAGINNTKPLTRKHTPFFIGVIGDKDFNYLEMLQTSLGLAKSKYPHHIIEFSGIHEWPDIKTMSTVFQCIFNNCYSSSPNYKLNATIGTIKLETDLKESYKNAFYNKDWDWWEKEIKLIYKLKDKMQESAKKLVYERVLQYLSLMSYLTIDKERKQYGTVNQKYLNIYEQVDPENPEVYYLKALTYEDDKEKMAYFLQLAIEKGLRDKKKLTEEKSFSSLFNSSIFNNMLHTIDSTNQINEI